MEQWVSSDEPAPKKAMDTDVWDAHGIVHIDYLVQGRCRFNLEVLALTLYPPDFPTTII